ncbi:hypothetical protein [Natronobeatus ordinarius]|uniref:hypothetical protein n=1 Tax=Natronobeatus ordinarius TaxID=2963433 RepID=UPI0020CC13FE|nr:hypothetical protein [Natronobeatus ordinarius]
MNDVSQLPDRAGRPLLAGSLTFFATAGVANTTLAASAQSLAAVAFVTVGVYGLARYARTVSRRTLATLSIGLWIAFLAVTPAHVVGVAAVGSALPVSTVAVAATLTALTWATLLGAFGTTTFLGFREYGAQAGADAPEERILEGDYDIPSRTR